MRHSPAHISDSVDPVQSGTNKNNAALLSKEFQISVDMPNILGDVVNSYSATCTTW